MADYINITTPVGRVVMGSLYKPRTTDAEGKPLQYKTGKNAGQPKVDYFIMLALPKGAEKHWAETAWGAEIWKAGHKDSPNAGQIPTFAWKIKDGDSQVPNKKGNMPCDNEGWKGNWVLTLTTAKAPEIYTFENGKTVLQTQANFVKPGNLIQAVISPSYNGSDNQPGIFIYYSMVCFRGYSEHGEIHFGPSADEAGFGAAPLPAGASTMPAAVALPLAPAAPVAPPPVPSVPLPNVTPNPGFLNVPVAPAVPSVVPPPPPAPVASGPVMTAAANGVSHAAYIAAGWNDAQLRANGLMV